MHARDLLAISTANRTIPLTLSDFLLEKLVLTAQADGSTRLMLPESQLTPWDEEYLHYHEYRVKRKKGSAYVKISWGPK